MRTVQPNHGLDTVFGALEDEVEFMPDIADRYNFEFDGLRLTCGGFLQSYNAEGGSDCGQFSDCRTAVIANTYESGRTLLIGSHPSVSHFRCATNDSREYFARLLDWAKVEPQIRISNPNVQARLQVGDRCYLWLINAAKCEQTGMVRLRDRNVAHSAWHWGRFGKRVSRRRVPALPDLDWFGTHEFPQMHELWER
ncbi:MAG: hypothetical protein ACR2O8_04710 [Rhizobiaceae bacterium]